MVISNIKIKDFRNLNSLHINPNKNLNLFYGKNGQGKTNFIEALYLLINGKNFRKSKREDVINYGYERAVIEADICGNVKKSIKIIYEKDRKILYINNKTSVNLKDVEPLKSILFNGETLFYFKNFSRYRIKFLDRMCCHVFGREFLHIYKTYKKTAENLKKGGVGGSRVWLQLLKKYSEEVNNYRLSLFEQIREEYEKVREEMDLKEIMINFKRSERSEVYFSRRDKKDLSVGELKGVVFALILALTGKMNGHKPILLIDDFNSEWDNQMKKKAADVLGKTDCQSFLMSTEEIKGYKNLYMEKGAIINR